MSFYSALTVELVNNLHQPYLPFYDSISTKRKLINSFNNLLKTASLYYKDYSPEEFTLQLQRLDPYMAGLDDLYGMLETEADKKLLVLLMANRVMYGKIQMPLLNSSYYELKKKSEDLVAGKSFTTTKGGAKLYETDLSPSFPLKIYQCPECFLEIFLLEMYRYKKGDITIGAKPGDYIIDGGGYFGETALYFSQQVGDTGKIFSFEFIPSNIETFKRNVAVNPSITERVVLNENPLWNISDVKFYYKDKGSSSSISDQRIDQTDGETTTITIDDFVERNGVAKIDLIKMDIEGAEYNALLGAAKTIDKFSPNLAIALYHSLDDFVRIPKLIKSINPKYKFYLDHFTPTQWETVLFATTRV